jgi:hypothetical protein
MAFDVALNRIKYYGNLQAVIDKFPCNDYNNKEALDRLKMLKRESKDRWISILKERNQGHQLNDKRILDSPQQQPHVVNANL